MLEDLSGMRLRKEEAACAERRVQEVTGWSDLVEDTCAGMSGGAGPSNRYKTRNGSRKEDIGSANQQEKGKTKIPSFRLSTEIERTMNLQRVLEKWILDSKVELSLERCWGRKGRTLGFHHGPSKLEVN